MKASHRYNRQPISSLMKSLLLCLLMISCLSLPSAYAVDDYQMKMLKEFQSEEPDIFDRVKLVEEGNRQLIEISLEDILHLVLNRSITLKASKKGEQAAESQLILAGEANQPKLQASIQQVKSGGLSSTNLNGESVNSTTKLVSPYLTTTSTDATVMSTSWSKKGTNGLIYSVSFDKTTRQTKVYYMMDKNDSFTGGSATDDPLEVAELTAGVSIPLFQDSGDINNVLTNRAQLAIDQSKLSTYSTTTSLLESVAKTYWTLVGIRGNIQTLEEVVNLSEQLVKETKARVDVGILNQTDLKEASIQLASSQQSLFSAKISEQEIEDQIREALSLSRIPFGFKPADLPEIHKEKLDFDSLLQKIYENNPTLKQLDIALKSNQYDLDEALNKDKTNLDVNIGYTLMGYGSSTGEALQNFGQDKLQGYQVGVTWTIPLFDKVTPERISKTRVEKSQLDLQISDVRSQLSVSLQTIIRNIEFGQQEEKNAILSRDLAKELMDKETEKLKIGKSTAYNVAQAQQKYTSAKYSETLVRVKNEQNFISLLALTGDLYDRYHLPKSVEN